MIGVLNGSKEDTAIAQSVGVRQRGTRLSLLGPKRSPAVEQQPDGGNNGSNGIVDAMGIHSRNFSKDTIRRSIFRAQSSDDGGASPVIGNGSDAGRNSLEQTVSRGEKPQEKESASSKRTGSVRKRLSMLGLRRRPSKGGGAMGSLDEE
jgi:hypothetical protein